MNELNNLWECDPSKNTECSKTDCRANGGECWCTTNKAFSTGKRAIRVDPELRREYRAEIVRTAQRKRRALAKENGLCPICCRNIPEAGHKTCKPCRVKITEANYKRYWRDKNGQKRND